MGQRWSTTRAGRACAVAAFLLVVAGSGCVERRLIIRTNPPGALAYVDDNEVGLTPVAISPIYYGSRKIRLVKDGCETLTVIQSVPPPWYEIPPLDFVSETLVPGKIHDIRTFDYQLRPQGVVPNDELLGRAEGLRQGYAKRLHWCYARLSGQSARVGTKLRAGPWSTRRTAGWRPARLSASAREQPGGYSIRQN